MKPSNVLCAAALILFTSVNAQEIKELAKNDMTIQNKEESANKKEKKEEKKELRALKGPEVSNQAKDQFARDFDNAQAIKWERTPNYDMATFIKDGREMSAYYDMDAQLIGTTLIKTFADLPAKAQKFIDSKYTNYSKEQIILFDDNELNETDMILYEQLFQDEDNYFVELKKENKEIILEVNMNGDVSLFKQLKN